MVSFSIRLLAVFVLLPFIALNAQAEEGIKVAGVPVNVVPDPDLSKLSVMAMWSQILPGPKGPMPGVNNGDVVPQMEARFILAVQTGARVEDACTNPLVDVTGKAPNAFIRFRGALKGNLQLASSTAPIRTYDVAICAVAMDPAAASVSVTLNHQIPTLYPGNVDPNAVQRPATMAGPALFGRRSNGGKSIRAGFLADSGCRGQVEGKSKGGRWWQDCEDRPDKSDAIWKWALPSVAKDIAKTPPDFIIHGGDHHYFYEEGEFGGFWLGVGRNRFEYWLYEFLNAAQPMMLAAPFVFVRGNHELCSSSWFGGGWFEMFGPRILDNTAPDEGDALNGCQTGADYSEAWYFDVAPRNDTTVPPFRFHVIDSGNDWNASQNNAFNVAAEGGRDKIWLTHIPPAMLLHYNSEFQFADQKVLEAVSNAFAQVAGCGGLGNFSCWPRAILTGHQHLYQKVELSSSASIATGTVVTEVHIAGHGGTAWDKAGLVAKDLPQTPAVACTTVLKLTNPHQKKGVFGPQDMHARITSVSRHGYLILERDAHSPTSTGWKITPHWVPAAQGVDLNVKVAECEG
ncbi:metallophosphoesterase [Roseovarius litorisediminis]|uniref:metallophosphoesterase n=1 Tax=Roseovarius litorisediminis TaxID=1312363 RepID=UPI0015948D8E|nr:metallophosphoesterase [Roseovarius litorisediminis]